MKTFPKSFGARLTASLLTGLVMSTLLAFAGPVRADDDAAALKAALAAERQRAPAPRIERTAFLSRSNQGETALSPDGRQFAYLREQGSNRSVWLLPTAGGEPRRVLLETEANEIAWSHDGRWLLLISPREVFKLAVTGTTGSGIVTLLGERTRREFFGVDASLPAAILVREVPPVVSRAPKRWRLWRVDMQGRQTLLREEATAIVDAAFAPQGRLAYLLRAEGEGQVIQHVDAAGQLHPIARCERMIRCLFLATSEDGRDLILRTNLGGEFMRPVRMSPDGAMTVLFEDPRGEADVDGIVLDPITRQPLIASYRSTTAASYGLTPDGKRQVDAIVRLFPQRNLQIDVGVGTAARWIVHERSGSLRGERLHVYDPATGATRRILDDARFEFDGKPVPAIAEAVMARKIAFSWRASDGMRLHGFLMVPPGVDLATVPLVANVHGGPFNLVRPTFSNDGQFLANRGYVVFQPNFRGSTGLGRRYLFAANGDFGNGRVQLDIVEGVRYLLAQGIGDANRVGITGASFGGYSTLLGVTFQPELFKVGIAGVPPADFGWVLREYVGTGTEMVPGVPIATSMRHLSLDPADPVIAQRLTAQSPIANADKLRRPLLMLAGGEDERVPIRGVTHYAAKLNSLHKDVSLFVDADAGHSATDLRTREAYYFLMEWMLHRNLGGPAPTPPSRELRAHIRKNLRLAGKDLQDLASP